MQKKTNIVVRLLACATAATGLFDLVDDFRGYISFPRTIAATVELVGPFLGILGVVLMTLPILKLVVAAGLFRMKRWAWVSAIVVLTIECAVALQSAVRIWIFSAKTPMPHIPPPSPDVTVTVISMGPTYITALLSLATVLVLCHRSVRDSFTNGDDA